MTNPLRSAPVWKKSSACAGTANCVEVAAWPDGGIAMRDNKDPQGPTLLFSKPAWTAFISEVRAGTFSPSTLRN